MKFIKLTNTTNKMDVYIDPSYITDIVPIESNKTGVSIVGSSATDYSYTVTQSAQEIIDLIDSL